MSDGTDDGDISANIQAILDNLKSEQQAQQQQSNAQTASLLRGSSSSNQQSSGIGNFASDLSNWYKVMPQGGSSAGGSSAASNGLMTESIGAGSEGGAAAGAGSGAAADGGGLMAESIGAGAGSGAAGGAAGGAAAGGGSSAAAGGLSGGGGLAAAGPWAALAAAIVGNELYAQNHNERPGQSFSGEDALEGKALWDDMKYRYDPQLEKVSPGLSSNMDVAAYTGSPVSWFEPQERSKAWSDFKTSIMPWKWF